VLILVLCLEGAVGVWSNTAMAANAISRGTESSAVSSLGHHEAAVAKTGLACADDGRVDGSPGKQGDDCDCLMADCTCPCTISTLAIVQVVPFAAQHVLALKPMAHAHSETIAQPSSAVFRPPIG
jgi:hypothetical protein